MKITPEKRVDKRLVRRHLTSGLISQDTLDQHLSGLPDVAESSEPIEAELDSVGIEEVVAKDTGETE